MQRKTMSDEDSQIIFNVIQTNNTALLSILFDKGVNLTIQNKDGETPLAFAHRLVKTESVQAIESFMQSCPSAVRLDNPKLTTESIKPEQRRIFELDISQEEKEKNTEEFFSALAKPDTALAIQCVVKGIDLTMLSANRGYTPIQLAARYELLDVVTAIAITSNTDAKDSARFGAAFIHVLMLGNEEVANALFNGCGDALQEPHTLNFNWSLGENEMYALHWAVHHNFSELVKKIVNAGADLQVKTKKGLTPRMLAQEMGREDCLAELDLETKLEKERAKALLEQQQKLLEVTKKNTQDLFSAIAAKDLARVENLLKCPVDLSMKNESGTPPFSMAFELKYWDVANKIGAKREIEAFYTTDMPRLRRMLEKNIEPSNHFHEHPTMLAKRKELLAHILNLPAVTKVPLLELALDDTSYLYQFLVGVELKLIDKFLHPDQQGSAYKKKIEAELKKYDSQIKEEKEPELSTQAKLNQAFSQVKEDESEMVPLLESVSERESKVEGLEPTYLDTNDFRTLFPAVVEGKKSKRDRKDKSESSVVRKMGSIV